MKPPTKLIRANSEKFSKWEKKLKGTPCLDFNLWRHFCVVSLESKKFNFLVILPVDGETEITAGPSLSCLLFKCRTTVLESYEVERSVVYPTGSPEAISKNISNDIMDRVIANQLIFHEHSYFCVEREFFIFCFYNVFDLDWCDFDMTDSIHISITTAFFYIW